MQRWQRVLRRAGGRDEGASAIEMAFLAPALLALIFFAVQAGLWWYGRGVALSAAREGVSQLRLAPDAGTYAQIRPSVVANTEQFATAVGRESLLNPVATPAYDDVNGRVSMTVTGSVITLWPGAQLTVTQQAFGEIERFEADVP
jgi:Flp pilus assembly protein TadG